MIGLLALAALAASASATFNLVCEGTMTSRIGGKVESKPFKSTYRFDLQRGRWCIGDCKSTKPVHAETDDEIILQQWKDGDFGYMTKINRETGTFIDVMHDDVNRVYYYGKCQRAPFTGLPEKQF